MKNEWDSIFQDEITVVVQGAIIGEKTGLEKNKLTKICLSSIRKIMPRSKIILSTWTGSDVAGLDYDEIVYNIDPGPSVLGDLSQNCFRQIASSIGGLKKVTTKYAIKMRSDLILTSANFIPFFLEYNQIPRDPRYSILIRRVATLSTCNPHRRFKFPYTVSDWFFFGLADDVRDIFDIPLIKRDDAYFTNVSGEKIKIDGTLSPEQYIWHSFLSKYREIQFKSQTDISHDNIAESEKFFANNAVLLPAKKAGVNWLKYPNAAYAQIPCLSNSGLYTFNDYKKLLKKYSGADIFIIPNILEELIYFVVYNLRFFLKEKCPKIHDMICRLVNCENHRRLDTIKAKSTSNL